MRRRLPVLVLIGLATMTAGALAQIGRTPPAQAAVVSATGSFEISNSQEGQPIFAAAGIAPGEAASGTVTIEDAGSEPVALHLRQSGLVDMPGLGGGVLSGRLHLIVVDVTDPAAPLTVYSGPLDSMPEQAVGDLRGGRARTFEFTATLPATGPPTFQNEVQGASTAVAYSWIVGEAEEEAGEEGSGSEVPAGAGTGRSGEESAGAGGSAARESDVGAGVDETPLHLTVPKIGRVLRAGRLLAATNCDASCRLSVRGRLRASAAGTHRVAAIRFTGRRLYLAGGRRLRIPVPRGLRRWLRERPGRERLRAKLRFVAVSTEGERDVVRKTVRLRVLRH
jgi:hypothetical protein